MAELEAPALRETARQFLEAEAGQLGIPLDPAEVLVRRAAGGTKMHVVAAARKLIGHLAATEADPLGSDSTRTPRASTPRCCTKIQKAGSKIGTGL